MYGLAIAVDGRTCTMLQCRCYLWACRVVVDVRVVLQLAVVEHITVGAYQRHAYILYVVSFYIAVERFLREVGEEAQTFLHARVVVLQLQVERVNLELFLALLLEHDERHGEHKEHREDAEV